MYTARDASFTKTDPLLQMTDASPPDNCPSCLKAAQHNQDSALTELGDGFALRGYTYHVLDFVLIKTESGPCDIGQIVELSFAHSARGDNTVTVIALGRISDIIDVCPSEFIKDEVRSIAHLASLTFLIGVHLQASSFPDRCSARSPR